jgi:hypothetical protein
MYNKRGSKIYDNLITILDLPMYNKFDFNHNTINCPNCKYYEPELIGKGKHDYSRNIYSIYECSKCKYYFLMSSLR